MEELSPPHLGAPSTRPEDVFTSLCWECHEGNQGHWSQGEQETLVPRFSPEITLLPSTKLLCAKGLLGSVLLPHNLLNLNLRRPLETQLRPPNQGEAKLDQSHIPLDICMAWDTPIGLGPVTDSAISCQVEGPKHLAQQIGETKGLQLVQREGLPLCQGVALF